MHKFGWFLIGLLLLAATAFYISSKHSSLGFSSIHDFSSWQEFIPRSELFKVEFPSVPQYAKDYVPIVGSDKRLRYDMYASEKIDGTLFLINVVTYPEEIDTSVSDDILHLTLDELMKSKPDNHLLHFEKKTIAKFPTLSFVIENTLFRTEGRILIHAKRVFILTYTTQPQNADPVEYQHFIKSFTFLPKTGSKFS